MYVYYWDLEFKKYNMHDRVATKHQKIIILTPIVTFSFFLPKKHKTNSSYNISVRSLSRCNGWCIPHTPTTSYLAKHQMPPDGRKTERLAAKRHRPEEKKNNDRWQNETGQVFLNELSLKTWFVWSEKCIRHITWNYIPIVFDSLFW